MTTTTTTRTPVLIGLNRLFFESTVSSLKLNENSFVNNNEDKTIQDPIEKIVVKYKFHPSILIIKNEIENTNTFRFKHVMLSDIKK